jgi:hypothetical protein
MYAEANEFYGEWAYAKGTGSEAKEGSPKEAPVQGKLQCLCVWYDAKDGMEAEYTER